MAAEAKSTGDIGLGPFANTGMAIPQGTADHVGRDMRIRQHTLGILQAACERFGFSPYEIPILENSEVFQGRYGEGEGSILHLVDRQNHHLSVPRDSTVSLARLLAMHSELPRPFRGYNTGRYFRDEEGEDREITQLSVDVVGIERPGDDAELIALAYSALNELGLHYPEKEDEAEKRRSDFPDFIIRINHRNIFQGIAELYGVSDRGRMIKIQRAINHFDRMDESAGDFRKELADQGIGEELIKALLQVLDLSGGPHYVLSELEKMVYSQAKGIGFKGLNELRKVVEALPREVLNKTEIDLSLACDSDYYTGFVMEGVVVRRSKKDKSVHEQMGKFVLSGGSYKDLVSSFGGKAEPAVGMAFYLENLLDAMEQLGMIDSLDLSRRRVLLSCAEERHASKLLQIGQSLRKNSFEVVTAHEILDNKFKRLKMALEEQCACVVCLDGMISVKPLPGYGSSALFKVLQKILENDGYGDGMSVAVIAEKESGEGELKREMEEIKRLGQPTYKFDPSQN